VQAAIASVTPEAQAIFLSCTNLRTLHAIAPIEAATGLPVFSSNQALAWHMSTLATGCASS
jgi:maleate isomerase